MDDMETSVETHGQFFVKFGQKSEDGSDNRVLLFIRPSTPPPGRDRGFFVAISRTGLGELRYSASNSSDINSVIANFSKGKIDLKDTVYKNNGEGDFILTIPDPDKLLEMHTLSFSPVEEENVYNSALQGSIKAAELPHREIFEKQQQEISKAQRLREQFSNLPPRP